MEACGAAALRIIQLQQANTQVHDISCKVNLLCYLLASARCVQGHVCPFSGVMLV